MPRYKITIEYLGTGLAGWQKQRSAPSVQSLLEAALKCMSNEVVIVHAAGRTDAGVHAIGQVGHFDLTKVLDPFSLARGINHFLRPHLISVTSCVIAGDDFHARFSAVKRHYLYRINNRPGCVAIDRDRVWWLYDPLDLKAMESAARYLVGQHDFTSFRASECQAQSALKTLDKLEIVKSGEEIHFYLSATSFLHHMVRNIVGTLVMVGQGKWQAEDVAKALAARRRAAAGPTAPAHGLYFVRVDY